MDSASFRRERPESPAPEGLGRVPPYSVEAERAVLAACMVSTEAQRRVLEILAPEDFYKPRHKLILAAISKLDDRGDEVDLLTLSDALDRDGELDRVGGVDYLADLTASLPTASNAPYWAEIVRRKSVLRSLITACDEVGTMAFDDQEDLETIMDEAEKRIFSLVRDGSAHPYHPLKTVVWETFGHVEEMFNNKATISGVPTGFRDLDEVTTGFQESQLIVLAARPAMGKTALCLNICANAAIHSTPQVPVLFFSLEMSRHELGFRMLCSEARCDGQRLRKGHIEDHSWSDLTMAASLLSEAPIFIDDSPGLTLSQIRSKARRAHLEHGIGLVIIDYMQLMELGGSVESRVQEISKISRSLKALARELKIPVMALSQLSRQVESRQDKRPMLSDLRESGAIEQDADIVLFIYRDEYYNPNSEKQGVAEIIVGKNRSGPTAAVDLRFFGKYAQFKDLARE